jgi:hypothetical protein
MINMDVVIPIVFPDYRITVQVQRLKVDIFPWVEFDNFETPSYEDGISNLGHAGVLFIDGATGATKYYEYGRYDKRRLGVVLKAKNLPDVKVSGGQVNVATLKRTLHEISTLSGQSGRIKGVYIEADGKFNAMLKHAEYRKSQNSNPQRKPYDLLRNSCIHFVKEIVEKAGVATPWLVDPRPNSYIGEFRSEFPDLDYREGVLHVESPVTQ